MTVRISLVLAGEGSAHGPLEALHVAGAGTVWALHVAVAAVAAPPRAVEQPAAAIVTPARAR